MSEFPKYGSVKHCPNPECGWQREGSVGYQTFAQYHEPFSHLFTVACHNCHEWWIEEVPQDEWDYRDWGFSLLILICPHGMDERWLRERRGTLKDGTTPDRA